MTTPLAVVIVGHHLPGREFCEPDGTPIPNVHVALQVRSDPFRLTAGDSADARWDTEITLVLNEDGLDFRGPAVHGRRGERFLYLTWGNVKEDGSFRMFRRAKLMLGDVEPGIVRRAADTGAALRADVHLTDGRGGPMCAASAATRDRLVGGPAVGRVTQDASVARVQLLGTLGHLVRRNVLDV